jgi:hypothetical protein
MKKDIARYVEQFPTLQASLSIISEIVRDAWTATCAKVKNGTR